MTAGPPSNEQLRVDHAGSGITVTGLIPGTR